ncbi:MAG: hypothetical protein J6Y85_04730 [Alphaproteobacteria bacterium]|nr:hypothetical protein [Alphaproteobacteria bacterium]
MKKLAVHLHLYYLKQLPRILKYLRHLEYQDYDLFVTMVEHNQDIEQTIKSFNQKATIMIVPNHGYDVGPFIEFLHHIDLNNYEYILKIHTKSFKSNNFTILNGYSMSNKLWSYVLWDSVLGSKEQIQKCFAKFSDKNTGMVGSKFCLTDEKRTYEELLPDINTILTKLGFKPIFKTQFIAGTMFYVRAQLMRPLLAYSVQDFNPSDEKIKNHTLAHMIERVVAEIILQYGYKISGVGTTKPIILYGRFFLSKFFHFCWQIKRTSSGALIIKILRIPVYYKKTKEKRSNA